MKTRLTSLLITGAFVVSSVVAETPAGLADSDWSSIRAAYEAGRHHFSLAEGGTLTARNPGLGWTMTFDDTGFTATDGRWTWGLELASSKPAAPSANANRLSAQRSPHLTEWFVNDQRGLEQGWTLTAPAEISLRVRGNLKPDVSSQSITFGGQLTYSGLKAWDAKGDDVPVWFEAVHDGFAVRYDDTSAQYPLTIDPLAQNAYIKASNTDAGDAFGSSVAISGDTVVVGAPSEASNATGVNGNQGDNSFAGAGAAYVFVRSGSTWSQQAYLKASNTGAGDSFGTSVTVSGDTVVVGATLEDSSSTGVNGDQADNSGINSGAAYVFVRTGSTWSQQAYLKASNTGQIDFFGVSVAVDGNSVVVGAVNEDSSGIDGDQSNNDLPNSGAAYVFVRSGSTWRQQAYLKASNPGETDYFGGSVAISGDTVVVGANEEDSGSNVINQGEADNSTSNAGAAYVFVRSGSKWRQQAYLKASNPGVNDTFGGSVAVSGDTVVVGSRFEASGSIGINSVPNTSSPSAGAAYVFVRAGVTWSQQAYLKASNTGAGDLFGYSVAVSGDSVVVGAINEDGGSGIINGPQNDALTNAGAAYVFVRAGSKWRQQAYLKASNRDDGDGFGYAVAVSGGNVVVGAINEDSGSNGINSLSNEAASNSGAAYLFDLGEVLDSLGRSTEPAPGGTDLAFGLPGRGALSPAGETLFESRLSGAGANRGRNNALFSTVAGPVALAMQTGSVVSGFADLPFGATIASVNQAIHNRNVSEGVFQATVKGRGLNARNNRLLLRDNGAFISPISRTGVPVVELGGAIPHTYREVLQQEGPGNQIALNYLLQRGNGVNADNDSGLMMITHAGSIALFNARAGEAAFGGGGVFGRFGRAATAANNYIVFSAKFIPTGGKPLDALFYTGQSNFRTSLLQGTAANGTDNGEVFRVFTGVTRVSGFGLLRSTLAGSATAANEGVWREDGEFRLRKGQAIGGGLTVRRIIRVWGINGDQIIAQVLLSGTNVNRSNNQAVILRQVDGSFLVQLRTGDPAPGIGLNRVTVAAIQAMDVDPVNGHYAILGRLRGAPARANQALWSGHTLLGNDGTEQFQRLPLLRAKKGERYHTESTPGDLIRSIALKPAVDPTGVGGRGMAQQINSSGQILLTITGDRRVQELVRLTP